MDNFYQVLELPLEATQEQIKKNYRTLAKKYHPDKNPDGEDKFKQIASAYQTLSDPEKKIEYDESISRDLTTNEESDSLNKKYSEYKSFNFSDLNNDLKSDDFIFEIFDNDEEVLLNERILKKIDKNIKRQINKIRRKQRRLKKRQQRKNERNNNRGQI